MVYQTPIHLYERDALVVAADRAVMRASRWLGGNNPTFGFAFRVDDATYSVCTNPDYDEYTSDTRIEIEAFVVTKVTDSGFRIRTGGWDHNPETRWIAKRWTKQFASRSPEDALRSYIERRKKMARIYEGRAQTARYWADKAEYLLQKEVTCPI